MHGGDLSSDFHVEHTFHGHRSMGPPARREWITECEPLRVLTRSREIQDGRKAVSARHKEGATLSNAIPDDWDEETSSGEEDNQIVWDNACDIFLSPPPPPLR
jgi:hypothetical protein